MRRAFESCSRTTAKGNSLFAVFFYYLEKSPVFVEIMAFDLILLEN